MQCFCGMEPMIHWGVKMWTYTRHSKQNKVYLSQLFSLINTTSALRLEYVSPHTLLVFFPWQFFTEKEEIRVCLCKSSISFNALLGIQTSYSSFFFPSHLCSYFLAHSLNKCLLSVHTTCQSQHQAPLSLFLAMQWLSWVSFKVVPIHLFFFFFMTNASCLLHKK